MGKEAYAAFMPTLNDVGVNEPVVVDFDGVLTFSPSWGDEFLSPLLERFGKRLTLKNTGNPSVKATIATLEEINVVRFVVYD